MSGYIIRTAFRFILVLIFVLTIGSVSFAQTDWLDIRDFSRVSLIGSKTISEYNEGQPLLNTIWFCEGNIHVGEYFTVVFEVPYIRVDMEYPQLEYGVLGDYYLESRTGNPYLGVEVGKRKQGPYGLLGFRPALTGRIYNYHATEMIFSHYGRLEAFTDNYASLTAGIGYRGISTAGSRVNCEVGFTRVLPTEDKAYLDPITYLNYRIGVRYTTGLFGFVWGLNGRTDLTDPNYNMDERSHHQTGFGADMQLGRFYPGAYIYWPLDAVLIGSYRAVYGISLTTELGA